MNLKLSLYKKWYDMIISGEKKEEYRDIKPYYISRFLSCSKTCNEHNCEACNHPEFINFDTICFTIGYNPKSEIRFKCCGISIGKKNPKWSSFQKTSFVIKIGEKIKV